MVGMCMRIITGDEYGYKLSCAAAGAVGPGRMAAAITWGWATSLILHLHRAVWMMRPSPWSCGAVTGRAPPAPSAARRQPKPLKFVMGGRRDNRVCLGARCLYCISRALPRATAKG